MQQLLPSLTSSLLISPPDDFIDVMETFSWVFHCELIDDKLYKIKPELLPCYLKCEISSRHY